MVRTRATLITVLLTALWLPPAPAQQTDTAREKLETVRERIGELKATIERSQKKRDRIGQALGEAEREIARVSKRLHELDRAVAAKQVEIKRLSAQEQRSEQQLQTRLDTMAGQIRAAYTAGRQGRLRLLLSQENPAAIGRLLTYYDYYAQAQSQAINQMRGQLQTLQKTRSDLTAQRKQLATARNRRAQLLTSLKTSQAERENALAAIESRLSGGEQKLARLKTDERELQGLIESLRERLADIPTDAGQQPFAQLKGRLPAPVSGRLIARYGQSKAGGQLRWKGHWIAAESGTPVEAAAAGRVVYVGWMHRYGQIVILDHGGQYYTLYGHTQAVYTEIGNWVKTGEVIGAAGTSGGHENSGVYFEIRHGRKPVDPASWLRS